MIFFSFFMHDFYSFCYFSSDFYKLKLEKDSNKSENANYG